MSLDPNNEHADDNDLQEIDAGAPTEDRGDVVTESNDDAEEREDAPDAEQEEEAAAPRTPSRIPKARFDEVNEERKEALRRNEELIRENAELKARQEAAARAPASAPVAAPAPAPAAFDEDAKETEYAEALLEGDAKKAASIRREINSHIRSVAANEAEGRITQRQAGVDLEAVTAQTLQDHPWLEMAEGAEALDLIVAARDAKIARGIAPAEALRQAVKSVAPRFAPAAAPEPAPRQGSTAAAPAADTRTAAALARGARDSALQPAALDGTGNRALAGRVDVAAMSDEQFESMTASEKKRLRGDL